MSVVSASRRSWVLTIASRGFSLLGFLVASNKKKGGDCRQKFAYLDVSPRISQMKLPNCKGCRAALSRLLETVYSDAC